MNDLAAITCFFSYSRNRFSVECFRNFKKRLEKQGVKLYAVELSFGDQEYLLGGEDVYLRLRTNTILWHKESLLNILVKRLPPHIKKIAWLDSDIKVEAEGWGETLSGLLDRHKIVQLGRTHEYLNREGKVERSHRTTGYGIHHNEKDWMNFSKHHPGLAWAASREFFSDCGGLFSYCLAGGGDGAMVPIFANSRRRDGLSEDIKDWIIDEKKYNIYKEHCPTMLDRIREYKNKVAPYVGGDISYLNCKIWHEWHAPQSRRGYATRAFMLKGVNLYEDLRTDESTGLFEWRDLKNNLKFEKFFSAKDHSRGVRRQISYENL